MPRMKIKPNAQTVFDFISLPVWPSRRPAGPRLGPGRLAPGEACHHGDRAADSDWRDASLPGRGSWLGEV
jgi:hypothetical protein